MSTPPESVFPPDFAALRGAARLAVYIDLKSPYAYLAIDPTRALARELGVEIDWRPFTLDIPSYLGSAKVDRKGEVVASKRTHQQWSGVKYAYMDARRYANLTGKTVRGTVKIWDSSLAGIAMLWAKRTGQLDAFLDVAYPPFWRRELDIEDVTVLEATLAEAGVATAGFRAFAEGPGREEHDRGNEAAFAAGVFGVPTYLVEDEMWFGREHLPRVAWLLAGRPGPAPDVTNRAFGADAEAPEPRSDAPGLSIFLDLRSPQSYLALEPALALAAELPGEVEWLPVTVPALRAPSEPGPDDDRGVLHRRHRARAIARDLAVNADARGLALREPYREPDTGAFVQGWLWLLAQDRERLGAYLRECFRAYWALELDPASIDAVAERLAAVGGDAEAFRAWAAEDGGASVARVADEVAERGVGGAPAYLVDGEYFTGRQHLPMIHWILGGRKGSGPI